MDEYASILLRFFCGSASRLPIVIVTAAKTANKITQLIFAGLKSVSGNATRKSLAMTAKPAALDAVDKKPETGVGAPSYTSGAQKWNGTIETLKPSPATRRRITPNIMGAAICPDLNASART